MTCCGALEADDVADAVRNLADTVAVAELEAVKVRGLAD